MKLILKLLLLIVGLSTTVYAQDPSTREKKSTTTQQGSSSSKQQFISSKGVNGSHREAKTDIYGYECSITGGEPKLTPTVIKRNMRFTILYEVIDNENDTIFIVSIWKKRFKSNSKRPGKEGNFYRISKYLIENNTVAIYSKKLEPVVIAGPLIIPIKLRFNTSGVSKDFSFGPAFGFSGRFSSRSKNNKYSLLFSVGASAITADSTSTRGTITQPTNLYGLYVSMGNVIHIDKFSIGIFMGTDFLSRHKTSNWIHHGKPWFGIGFGIHVFGLRKDDNDP